MVGCGKVSCILHHWGIQLILAYVWTRPAILVAGKDIGGLCFYSFTFIPVLLSVPSLSGVVGWCEGAVYLTSPGRPTDIGLQLGKACYPCSG